MRKVGVSLLLLLGLFTMTLAGCGGPQVAQYTLTINAQGQGTVTPASGGKFDSGTVVELTPTADSGWAFTEWSGTDGDTVALDGTTYKIVMDKDKTVTAVFAELHDLNVTASPAEAGSVDVAIVSTRSLVPHGQTVRVTAQANSGYIFDHWQGDLTGIDNPSTFVVDGPKTITAVFVPAIKGRVTGANTLAGISGVTIAYDGGTTVTDSEGYFIIKNASGTVTIAPSAPVGAFDVAISPSSRTVTWPCETANFAVSWIQFSTVWGSTGSGNGQFDSTRGVAVDSAGDVYVADLHNNRIQKFTNDGAYLAQWGGSGTGDGQFNLPSGVAVDSAGNVYVADLYNHRIQKFASSGAYLTQWGGSGTGDGQFSYPTGVAVDSTGNVYVADSYNHRIQKFTSDGTYVTQWGGSGSGDGQFSTPNDVAVDSAGHVYVADYHNHRIQKFTSDGTYVTQWGANGTGDGQFNYPHGVAVDSAGNVYVADLSNHRIQKFTGNGTYLTKWGSRGTGNGQFNTPYYVTVDSAGNVFVSDTENNRIQKFRQVN